MLELGSDFSVLKFYGSDWAAMFFTFLQLYLLGKKNPLGFGFGILANVCWTTFGLLAGSIANPLANLIFIGLNIKGILNWRRDRPEATR